MVIVAALGVLFCSFERSRFFGYVQISSFLLLPVVLPVYFVLTAWRCFTGRAFRISTALCVATAYMIEFVFEVMDRGLFREDFAAREAMVYAQGYLMTGLACAQYFRVRTGRADPPRSATGDRRRAAIALGSLALPVVALVTLLWWLNTYLAGAANGPG